jgi:hypothetical protein
MRNQDITKGGTVITEKIMQGGIDEKSSFDKKQFYKEKREEEFKKSFKNLDSILINQDVKVPEILYLANKAENGFEGDILSDFYKMFPHAASELDADGNPIEPLFISAEHGDGLTDLF